MIGDVGTEMSQSTSSQRPTSRQDWRDWLLSDTPASRAQAHWGRIYLGWLAFRGNRLAMVGLVILLVLLALAALAPWLAPFDPLAVNLNNRLRPPDSVHWLGTDQLGRDIWSRIISGARITLLVVALVAVTAAPLGLLIGTIAGYFGGWVDSILMRITDIFLAFPRLILALAFVAALRPHRAGRNPDRTQQRLHRRGPIARRLQRPIDRRSHHAPVPVLADRAGVAGYGGHYPDGGGLGLPGPGGAAAVPRMGRDDLHRPAVPAGSMVGGDHARVGHFHCLPRL